MELSKRMLIIILKKEGRKKREKKKRELSPNMYISILLKEIDLNFPL